MGDAGNAVQSAWNRQSMAWVPARGQSNVTGFLRWVPVLSLVIMAMAVGGCTGTVRVEPTDLSAVDTGADRKTVEQAVGKPKEYYKSRGTAYASYRYNRGGARTYSLSDLYFGDSVDLSEVFLAIVALPLYPVLIPIGHAVVRPVEHMSLRLDRRAWLCVTYGEDQIAIDVKTAVPSPCEPPGGIWGDKGGNSHVESKSTGGVDPAIEARVVAYLDNNMQKFVAAMRNYGARNPYSFTAREGTTTVNMVHSYEVREANEERIVLRVVFGYGRQPQTKLLLVTWEGGELEVVAHRDDAPSKEASSS